MFNPSNIDEVSIQAMHLEASKGKYGMEDAFVDPWSNKTTRVKKERPTCSHRGKGHKENQCWTLHLEMLPKKFKKKRKKSTIVIVQHDLIFDSRDESLITAMGFKGMLFSSSNSSIQSLKSKYGIEDERRSEPEKEVPDSLSYGYSELHNESVTPFGEGIQNMKKTVDYVHLTLLYVIWLFANCFWLKGMTMNAQDDMSKGVRIDVNSLVAVIIMCGQFVVM